MLENSLAAMKLSDAKKARSAEIVTSYVTLKQSLNRPGQTMRFPGSSGPQISRQIDT